LMTSSACFKQTNEERTWIESCQKQNIKAGVMAQVVEHLSTCLASMRPWVHLRQTVCVCVCVCV
jgi:hypothetical protein